MTGMARSLGELMTALGLDPAIIAGHSAGAAIAIRMALDGVASPRAIVGLNAALLPFPGLAGTLFPTLARVLFVNPLAPHVYARMARVPGGTARFLARSTGSKIDAVGIACYERLLATPGHCEGAITMMANWDLPTLKRDLPRLHIPLLLIHGAADPAIPLASAREAAAMIGMARLVSLPGLGHMAHEEKPEEVASLITEFAEELV
jgi:magnesium chelatase accessory protein